MDPERNYLMRRAAYKAMPDIEGIAENADWFEPSTYTGEYDPVESNHNVSVVDEHGALWVRTAEMSMRLWPSVDSPHRFRALQGWVTFRLEDGQVESVQYQPDGGGAMEAVRVR